jgi:hypothetical protein
MAAMGSYKLLKPSEPLTAANRPSFSAQVEAAVNGGYGAADAFANLVERPSGAAELTAEDISKSLHLKAYLLNNMDKEIM